MLIDASGPGRLTFLCYEKLHGAAKLALCHGDGHPLPYCRTMNAIATEQLPDAQGHFGPFGNSSQGGGTKDTWVLED